MVVWLSWLVVLILKPYNLKTFPISESRESSLALPSAGNEGAANLTSEATS